MIDIVKICVVCKTGKSIYIFYIKYREYKTYIVKRVLKRHYNNKDIILQQSRDKFACFKELDKRLKALEEKLSICNLTT